MPMQRFWSKLAKKITLVSHTDTLYAGIAHYDVRVVTNKLECHLHDIDSRVLRMQDSCYVIGRKA
jgi:hypothetical protein